MKAADGLCQCGCGGKTAQLKWNRSTIGYRKGDYRRFLPGHNIDRERTGVPLLIRLFRLRRIEGDCWIFTGAPSTSGYGVICVGKDEHYIHRAAYELFNGPIPDGLHIDHLCRRKLCFNPEHLEPVTCAENIRRGESPTAVTVRTKVCQRGHAMTPDNIYVRPDGTTKRLCRKCIQLRRRWQTSKRQAAKLVGGDT